MPDAEIIREDDGTYSVVQPIEKNSNEINKKDTKNEMSEITKAIINGALVGKGIARGIK